MTFNFLFFFYRVHLRSDKLSYKDCVLSSADIFSVIFLEAFSLFYCVFNVNIDISSAESNVLSVWFQSCATSVTRNSKDVVSTCCKTCSSCAQICQEYRSKLSQLTTRLRPLILVYFYLFICFYILSFISFRFLFSSFSFKAHNIQ